MNDEDEYKVEEDNSYNKDFETDSSGDSSETDSKKNIMKIGLWFIIGLIAFLIILVVIVSMTSSGDEGEKVSNEKSITLARGDKMAIEHNSDTFSWNSSNKDVAIVTEDGQIEALKEGDAVITIKIDNDTYKIKVHVEGSSIVVTDIKLDKNKLELEVGDTYELKANVSPEEAKDVELSWHSSNESVVTVDKGKIKALAVGSSTITVKTGNGYTDICVVQVKSAEEEEDDITAIDLGVSSIILKAGIEYTLDYSVEPKTAKVTLAWDSSDTDVAIVQDGVIKTKAPGTTTITVRKANIETELYLTVVKGDSSTPDVIDDGKEIKAVSISVNQTELNMKNGTDFTLVATVLPSNTTNKTVTYTSANESIAKVDATGKVTAVGNGETTITASTTNGITTTVKVTVSEKGPVKEIESISLDLNNVTMNPGDKKTLNPTYSPSDATAETLRWSSSNMNVAIVENGTITAVSPGTAVIVVSNGDGVEAYCIVDVSASAVTVQNIAIEPSSVSLKVNGKVQLSVVFYPMNATNKTITWSSSNKTVAVVDSNGLVTAKKAGYAVIYARSANGVVAVATITVQ